MRGEHLSRVWTVSQSGSDAQLEMIKEFITFCENEALRMQVDPQILLALDRLKEHQKSPPAGYDKEDLFKLSTHLKSFTVLPIYGYNSSRYDLNIIFSMITKCYEERGFNRSAVNLLKKGRAYFSFSIGRLHFKDLLNFTCPMPLDRFLKTWTTDCVKLVYPYETFSTIEEIRSQKEFPDISEFKSTLKGDVDEELYATCKQKFDDHMSLPPGHPQKWYSFEDYLKFYNISDVKPASLAMITQFKTYRENFGVYPNHFLGLPSFAKYAMFMMFDSNCPSIFTFHKTSDATKVFREGIIGGLTNVYKRHVTLDENEPAAHRAKYSKRGKKWHKIAFYDINSMYPATFGEKFPTGIGFEWTPTSKGVEFTKKLMTGRKISLESLQWLDYMQKEKFKLFKPKMCERCGPCGPCGPCGSCE